MLNSQGTCHMVLRLAVLCLSIVFSALHAVAQDAPASPTATAEAEVSVEPPAPGTAPISAPAAPVAPVSQQLTLMTMIEQGGAILWFIMGLSFFAIVLALYLLLTVTPRREAPMSLVKRA